MNKENKDKTDWLVIASIVIVGYAFYVGVAFGIICLVISLVVLGWNKRHKGRFPTDDDKSQ